MSRAEEWVNRCLACGAGYPAGAIHCPACGASLTEQNPDEEADREEANLELSYVPPAMRETVRNFDEEAEAEIACGFLRAQGIPAELGTGMIPGLAYNIALWVPREYLDTARRLLDEADQAAATAIDSDGD